MKIAILAAMDKEMALLKGLLHDAKSVKADDVECLAGRIGEHEVVLAKCGIGKVNAALNTYKIIRAFGPQLVINSGVAGGAGPLGIGGLLVAGEVAYHDVWCGPGTEPGAADGYPRLLTPSAAVLQTAKRVLEGENVSYGLIATGDTFISHAEEISRIHEIYPDAVAVDRESAAIAQTCKGEGVEFAIIRVVSDTPGQGENIDQYKNFWSDAPLATFKAVSAILQDLK